MTDLLAVCEADDLVSVTSSRLISSNLDIICPSGIHAKAEGADTTRLFCKSLEFRSRVKNKAGDGLTVLLFVNTSHEKTKTISTSHCFQPNLWHLDFVALSSPKTAGLEFLVKATQTREHWLGLFLAVETVQEDMSVGLIANKQDPPSW